MPARSKHAIIGYIRYSVEYQVQGEDQWISLYQGEESLININITVNYKANVSGKVKKNEEVQYTAVVENLHQCGIAGCCAD